MTRLYKLYKETLREKLSKEFGYSNALQIPKLRKIVVNMGVGEAVNDSKKVGFAQNELALITGQKPVVIKAKKSVATFKLREGMPIGCKVTLRRDRMYEFLDRLINVACRRFEIFGGSPKKALMVVGTSRWVFKSRLCFQKSTMIKSRK